jgi:membrane-associated phospholipid phosphatase
MRLTDYIVNLLLSAILIIGSYQFYFWCQRNPFLAPRQFKLPLDEWIPYWPSWVWIYSCLYYPIILYLNFVIGSAREFTYVATSYMLLLALQMLFFVLLPVTTPRHWRGYNRERTLSERFLAVVQRIDAPTNSFPSMHVSVAMLTAMHLVSHLGAVAYAFPVVIALSCLFTKQHYVVDLPAGALLGWWSFATYRTLI